MELTSGLSENHDKEKSESQYAEHYALLSLCPSLIASLDDRI